MHQSLLGKVDNSSIYSRHPAYDAWPFNAATHKTESVNSGWWDMHGTAGSWLDMGNAAAAGMHATMANYATGTEYSSFPHTLSNTAHLLSSGKIQMFHIFVAFAFFCLSFDLNGVLNFIIIILINLDIKSVLKSHLNLKLHFRFEFVSIRTTFIARYIQNVTITIGQWLFIANSKYGTTHTTSTIATISATLFRPSHLWLPKLSRSRTSWWVQFYFYFVWEISWK